MRMKSSVIAVLSASAILAAGCDYRDLDSGCCQKDYPVVFSVNDMPMVKGGAQLSASTLNDFVVAASHTDAGATSRFMSGAKAEKTGSVWTTDPTFYYPVSGELSFYAYAPYAASLGVSNFCPDSDGIYSLDYTPPVSVADQNDFCPSEPLGGISRTSAPAALTFHHATSQVLFKARTADTLSANRKMYIDTIKVKGVVASKHLTYLDSIPYYSWSDLSSPTTAEYEITADAGGLTSSPLSIDVAAISTDAGRMYLIPQTISSGAVVSVSWRLMDTTGGTPTEVGRGTETLNLSDASYEWLPSKRYTYVLYVKPGGCRFYTYYAYFDEESDIAIPSFTYGDKSDMYFGEEIF